MSGAEQRQKTMRMVCSHGPSPQPFISVDVFDLDGAAVAEIDHQDGEADRRLGGGHGQHQHGEDLADHVAQEDREGDEVDVDREQHQLDDIRMMMTFLRFRKMPKTPMVNRIAATVR